MNYNVATSTKIRMITVLVLFLISAAGIVARAVQLQILDSSKLRDYASRQRRHTIEVRARRGDILDSAGEVIAVSRQEAQVYVQPEKISDPATVAKSLAPLLGMDKPSLMKKLTSREPFVWLTRQASSDQAEAVTQALTMLGIKEGIGLLPASRRFYPGGSLAANLIGFTGLNEKEGFEGLKYYDEKGLEGLEYKYDEVMAGKPIRIWLERDARGNPIFLTDQDQPSPLPAEGDKRDLSLQAGAKGTSLKLTILRPLQYVAERELYREIKNSGAKSGCVVAMEPETGRVLAMASYPTFDPNNFSSSSQENFRNRCVVHAYEPGSTFKVFITAAALDAGAIGPRDRFFCENGFYVIGGETISDHTPYGWLNVKDIVAQSSNIGASKIAEKLGKDRMYAAIRGFGFGEKTGVDCPGESSGIVRKPSLWSQVAVGTISFGQGVAVTPIQLVTALSAIANGGVLMRPYVVESQVEPDGTVRPLNNPRAVGRIMRSETAGTVTRYMEAAVSEGTGKKAAVPGYRVAGKTGTAQKPMENGRGYAEGKYVVSFMGFLPAERPRLAMIVVIDEPDSAKAWGGTVAAPVFKIIAEQAMVLLKVPSDEGRPAIAREEFIPVPANEPGRDPETRIRQWEEARAWQAAPTRRDGEALAVPDLRGLTLRQALRALSGLPVAVEVQGSGIVTGMSPAPGTGLKDVAGIRLNLETAP